MTARMGRMSAVTHLFHRHILKRIVLSYGLAAACPASGLWIEDVEILDVVSPHGRVTARAAAAPARTRDAGPGRGCGAVWNGPARSVHRRGGPIASPRR